MIPSGSQTVGPYFAIGMDRPEWSDLTRNGAKGEKIRIEGAVIDGDGAPVPDALVEIWQANAAGKYDHPDDTQDKPTDPRFVGFGRCATTSEGIYRFTTIRPGQVPGRGNSLQAPHINLSVFGRGILKQLVTRIYFADKKAENESDPLLSSIADPKARETLLAKPGAVKDGMTTFRFDVVLQGKGETVFLEI